VLRPDTDDRLLEILGKFQTEGTAASASSLNNGNRLWAFFSETVLRSGPRLPEDDLLRPSPRSKASRGGHVGFLAGLSGLSLYVDGKN